LKRTGIGARVGEVYPGVAFAYMGPQIAVRYPITGAAGVESDDEFEGDFGRNKDESEEQRDWEIPEILRALRKLCR
jgi:hypothetical protein